MMTQFEGTPLIATDLEIGMKDAEDGLADFESAPLNTYGGGQLLKEAASFINKGIQDYVLALGGNGLSFVASAKPTEVKVLNKHTLRVFFKEGKSDHLKKVHLFEKEHAKHVKHKNFKGIAFFANYSAIPHSPDDKTPARKREVYFAVANKGVSFKPGLTSGSLDPSKPQHVVFKDVAKIIAISDTGDQVEYTDGELVKIIGHGENPFKPNGLFVNSMEEGGKRQYSVMSFDKAQLDSKTHDVTFEVGFLQAAQYRSNIRSVPHQFMEGEDKDIDTPTLLYLDNYKYGGSKI